MSMTEAKEARGLETLQVWRRARELMLYMHQRVVPALPAEEKWDLASQIRRSSKSVMANIAEGYGRYYYQETVRFCYIARGSLEETRSHLITAADLGYIPQECLEEARQLIQSVHELLHGYIAYLKRTRRGGDLPKGSLSEPTDTYYVALDDSDVPNPESPITNPFHNGGEPTQ